MRSCFLRCWRDNIVEKNAQHAGDMKNAAKQTRRGIGLGREINLSEPYEKGLAAALSLRRTNHNGNADKRRTEKVTKVFRRLYEAANGRQIWTVIGPITIGPAVAPWLKEAPLFFETEKDLLEFIENLNGAPTGDLGIRR
jgi:hypothetical protein